MESKICGHCKEDKLLVDFPKNKCKSDGYGALCKHCQYTYTEAWRQNNKTHHKNVCIKARKKRIKAGSTKELECSRRYEAEVRPSNLRLQLQVRITSAKKRVAKWKQEGDSRGSSFDLDVDYLETLWVNQKGLCAVSGIAMSIHGKNRRDPNTMSLDRIDSSKGYTKNNVRLVTWLVNKSIGEYGTEAFIKMCIRVVENIDRKTYEI